MGREEAVQDRSVAVHRNHFSFTIIFHFQQLLHSIYPSSNQCCIQKMWLGGQTESFQNVGEVKVYIYDVLTF